MIEADRLLFIGGLHRSGTTPLARALAAHQAISGLHDTGVTEDEGQHLQTVYPPANTYGGPGHFARDPRSHLIETSPLIALPTAESLLDAWQPFWNLDRHFLLEKSPPNLIMGRFLQTVFPGCRFIMVLRHPVTVALSTKKWTRLASRDPLGYASLSALVEHWFIAHRIFLEDLPHLDRVLIVHYEHLVSRPDDEMARISDFLELNDPFPTTTFSAKHSMSYQDQWNALRHRWRPGSLQRQKIQRTFAQEARSYGYELNTLFQYDPSTDTQLKVRT